MNFINNCKFEKFNEITEKVKKEFQRSNRYWNSIYSNEDQFLKHFLVRLVASEKKGVNDDPPIEKHPLKEANKIKKLNDKDPEVRKKACENLLIISKNRELNEKTIKLLYTTSREDTDHNVKRYSQKTLDKLERKILPEERYEIYKRDNNACLCCGEKKYLQIDHIKPKWLEINNSYDNLQTLLNFVMD